MCDKIHLRDVRPQPTSTFTFVKSTTLLRAVTKRNKKRTVYIKDYTIATPVLMIEDVRVKETFEIQGRGRVVWEG